MKANGFPATLTDPGGTGPIVVFVAGSGPTDRDGDSILGVSASYLRKLADAMAADGIATLRYDKRGVAGSLAPGPEDRIVFDTFVDDLDRVLDWANGAFPQRSLVLLGHSEGGMVALRAAHRRDDISAIVLVATPGRPAGEVLRDQLRTLPDALPERALAILSQLEAGEHVRNIPPELLGLFRPGIQNFVISLLARQPAEDLQTLNLPVLVIGGGSDIQVGRADFAALSRAREGVESRWFAEMNHVLTDAPGDRPGNILTYADPQRPLTQGLVQTIVAFLRRAL